MTNTLCTFRTGTALLMTITLSTVLAGCASAPEVTMLASESLPAGFSECRMPAPETNPGELSKEQREALSPNLERGRFQFLAEQDNVACESAESGTAAFVAIHWLEFTSSGARDSFVTEWKASGGCDTGAALVDGAEVFMVDVFRGSRATVDQIVANIELRNERFTDTC